MTLGRGALRVLALLWRRPLVGRRLGGGRRRRRRGTVALRRGAARLRRTGALRRGALTARLFFPTILRRLAGTLRGRPPNRGSPSSPTITLEPSPVPAPKSGFL